MKATLTIDGIALPLGAVVVEAILDELIEMNDGDFDPGWRRVLATLAEHPDPAIRSLVCRAASVPLTVLRQLVEDQDIAVIEALIEDSDKWKLLGAEDRRELGLEHCPQPLSFVDEGHIKRWLSWPCSRLHLALAENIDKFNADCTFLIADELMAHPSYRVRAALAGNGGHSADHKRLARDQDPGVRAIAARTLAELADIADAWDDDENGDEG